MSSIRPVFLILTAVLFAGCGGGPVEQAKNTSTTGNSASAPQSNANLGGVVANTDAGSVPSNVAPDTRGVTAPDPNAPMPSIDTPGTGGIGQQAGRRQIVEGPPLPPGTKTPVMPAPENSEVQTTMGKDGSFIETRTFKDHKYLIKAVRTVNGRNESVVVYLKNGRSVKIPSDKIPSVVTVPSILLTDLAGVKQPPPPPTGPPVNKAEILKQQGAKP
ncbi:MAG: hypothetical protein KF736_12830 [Acidobacteria bacterium]|nr:hypothetical protein [Acidobacteriota bacterium]MCW5950405.1 hypothetical protein [Pyrinomonadaceae bacterium]